jgi:type I restriction enzyme S subunit
MDGLTASTLAEVCSLVTDGTHDTPKRVASGYPLIKAKEITGGRIDFETCDQISEEEHLEVIARSKPEFGDTLFAHIGASLGEAAFVNTTREFSIKNVALFKPNPAVIDARYLYYLVISPAFQALAKGTKTGSAQPFLGLSQLRGHYIQFHRDLATQRRIGAILSSYDELMENSQRRIRLLEAMARALYREWFVQFRAPGMESNRRINSPLGPVPHGWEVKPVESFCPLVSRGVTPKYEAGSGRFIINQKVNRGSELSLDDLKELETSLEVPADKFARFGDVLVNCLGEGTIGRVHFYAEQHQDWAVDQHMSICRAAKPSDSLYVYFALESPEGQGRITSLKTGGTNMTMFNISALRSFALVEPPPTLRARFAELALPMMRQRQALTELIRNLRRTRNLLLPRLLSGQVNLETN